MANSVRVAVIGLGQRGLQHLKALWRLQGEGLVEVVALGDATSENLKEAKLGQYVQDISLQNTETFTEFDRLYSTTEPDAIYFCIPPGFHSGELVGAAQKGTHIFAEKPMSLFLDEAIEMDSAIREAGVISTAGFQKRYEPQSKVAHDFLADKRMVMVSMIADGFLESHSVKHTQTKELGGPADRVWTKNRAWSGSTVVEAGIHQTDLMRYWCGDIEWVQAAYVPRDDGDIEDGGDNPYAYSVTYGFKGGGIGILMISKLRKVYRNDGYQNILWDHGHLKFEGKDVVAYYFEGEYPPSKRPGEKETRHVIPVGEKQDSTEAIARAFVGAVAAGSDSGLQSTFGSSMNSLAAVLAANVSHEREGERVDLEAFATSVVYSSYRAKP